LPRKSGGKSVHTASSKPLSPSAPESLTSIGRNETTDFDITAKTDIPNDGFAKHLKGRDGDRIDVVLAAAGFNFSLLLRWFAELLRVLLLILCRHLAPPHLA